MFEKRCEGCPFITELQEEIAEYERKKAAAIENYFQHADERADFLTTENLPEQTVTSLRESHQKYGQSIDRLVGSYEAVVETDEMGIKYAKVLCVTPYAIRRALLLGANPGRCTSLLHLISK